MWRWYHEPELSHYFRGFLKGASFEECANAPAMIRAHLLVGFPDGPGLLPVGLVSLADMDTVLRVYRLGLLVDPKEQHKGYGKDLLEAGLKWAFYKMNAHKVVFEVMSSDDRILRGIEPAGFVYEGTRRQSVYLDGKLYDEKVYSLLQSEYREKNL